MIVIGQLSKVDIAAFADLVCEAYRALLNIPDEVDVKVTIGVTSTGKVDLYLAVDDVP